MMVRRRQACAPFSGSRAWTGITAERAAASTIAPCCPRTARLVAHDFVMCLPATAVRDAQQMRCSVTACAASAVLPHALRFLLAAVRHSDWLYVLAVPRRMRAVLIWWPRGPAYRWHSIDENQDSTVGSINADLRDMLVWAESNKATFEPTKIHFTLIECKLYTLPAGTRKITPYMMAV